MPATPATLDSSVQFRPTAGEPTLLEEQRELLRMLAFGLSDQSIGRRLGLSRRTVQRRVRSLMDLFDADTRFQLGLRSADVLSSIVE
ncbi:MAG: LuxR C-terminal-related transcriptional regulator [Stackebrandtia sp.]